MGVCAETVKLMFASATKIIRISFSKWIRCKSLTAPLSGNRKNVGLRFSPRPTRDQRFQVRNLAYMLANGQGGKFHETEIRCGTSKTGEAKRMYKGIFMMDKMMAKSYERC